LFNFPAFGYVFFEMTAYQTTGIGGCVLDERELSELLQENMTLGLLANLVMLVLLFLLIFTLYYLVQIGNQHLPEQKRLAEGNDQRALLFFLLIGALIFVWFIVNRDLVFSLVTPFLIAAAIAYAVNPLINFLIKHGLSRLMATLALFISVIVVVALLSVTLLPRLAGEIRDLGLQLPELTAEWYERLGDWYRSLASTANFMPETLDGLIEFFDLDLQSIRDWMLDSVGSFIQRVTTWISSLVFLVIIPVLTFYFLKDGDMIFNTIKRMIPPHSRRRIYPLARDIDGVLGGFIRGQLMIAAFVGVLSTIALLIIGVDYAILIGVIAGISNIVPYLGPVIGGGLAVLFALLISPFRALMVIVAFLVIQQVESSILEPYIFSGQVGLHPALVVLALLAGGSLGGLLGLLIAVPTAAVIRVLVLAVVDWFREKYPRYFET
jgi:predicted PurR-regulated permease PerM